MKFGRYVHDYENRIYDTFLYSYNSDLMTKYLSERVYFVYFTPNGTQATMQLSITDALFNIITYANILASLLTTSQSLDTSNSKFNVTIELI